MDKKYTRPMSIDKIREIHGIIREYGGSSTLEAVAIYYDNLARASEDGLLDKFAGEYKKIANKIREANPN